MSPARPRIALDGRLTQWPGVHRYALEIAHALAAQVDDLDFVWVCAPGDEARWPQRSGTEAIAAPLRPLSLQEQGAWPGWQRRHGITLWHAPVAHHLPWASAAPLVVTMHDLILHHLPRLAPGWHGLAYYRLANAVAMRQARRVVCISQTTHDDVARVWPAARPRLRTVLHGVADRFRQPAAAPPASALPAALQGRGGYLLYVGTCKPHKNLPRLLAAYAALPDALRLAHPLVLLVSMRDRHPDIDDAANRLGLAAPGLRWLEGVSESTLAALYAHARAVVLVSLMEGWGAPVSEAMGSGTPSVVSAGSAQAEVAGPAGLGCDPLDTPSITAALRQILTDDALHARLSAQARSRAGQLDWSRTARLTADVYREALTDGDGKRPR